KRWDVLGEVLARAAELGLRRDSVIAGLGGGVVCDLAALAAALYMRGTRLVLVPTSLVAMSDAAIGGKSAVDMAGIRNLAGTTYVADEVRIHTGFLASLPEREYRAGLAEVIRTGLIAAPKVEDLLRTSPEAFLARDVELLEETVRRCVAAKASLAERDPYDVGMRRSLNLGHSFGHGLEAVKPELLHGEAVAWGIGRALDLGLELGLTEPTFAASTRALLELYGFALSFDKVDAEALLAAMRLDKKAVREGIRLVIPRDTCSVSYELVDEARILAVLRRGLTP
ncbi:MAG TPA: 3-dehydroquinate synthase family protein, partial [Rectinemataceae bacterium]|nr:3-dehydroquinate synthase family protein [Rectinemataceae bacterium]